jgi:aspartyl-tRNA(Asn)/glutamyl-tRNA(Gln) amidotransferase subunit B
MPEPDIPVVEISDEDVDRISEELVPLPSEKKLFFTEKIGVTDQASELLTANRQIAEAFERLEKTLREKTSLKRKGSSERGLWVKGGTPDTGPQESRGIEERTKGANLTGATGPAAADFVMGPVFSYLNATGEDFSDISDKLELFSQIIEAKELGEITRSKYDEIIQESLRSGQDPNMLLEETRKESLIATGENLTDIVKEVIQKNTKAVEDYKGGKQATLGFLVGQVMQATRGAADPNEVRDILIEQLK